MKAPGPKLSLVGGIDMEDRSKLPRNIKSEIIPGTGLLDYRYVTKKSRGEILKLCEVIRSEYGWGLFDFDMTNTIQGEGGIFIGRNQRSVLSKENLWLLLNRISREL